MLMLLRLLLLIESSVSYFIPGLITDGMLDDMFPTIDDLEEIFFCLFVFRQIYVTKNEVEFYTRNRGGLLMKTQIFRFFSFLYLF